MSTTPAASGALSGTAGDPRLVVAGGRGGGGGGWIGGGAGNGGLLPGAGGGGSSFSAGSDTSVSTDTTDPAEVVISYPLPADLSITKSGCRTR